MKHKKEDTTVIVVDDGSIIKDHITWINKTFSNIKVIEKLTNGGIAKCKNTCLRALFNSGCDIFFLLDDDIEVLQTFEDKYKVALEDECVFILSGGAIYNQIIGSYSSNTNITKCLNGYFICFTKNTFKMSGFFKVFPAKYGHEHVWYTYRVMRHCGQTHFIDIKNSELYINLIDIESSVCDEQKKQSCDENYKFLCISNYEYEDCVE